MANVKFLSVKLKSTFESLETKDELALYWIDETQELYKGQKLYGTGSLASEKAAGLLSPEDYIAFKELISKGSCISDLRPVDGSIIIAQKDETATIKVGLSAVEGNMLLVKGDGLYVAETKVPEYSIEKQEVAEDGFAVSYKLKKTVNGEDTYVGDTINIAKDMVLQGATLETVSEENVPYDGAVVGDPYIDMAFNDAAQSHIYIPVKGLVDTYTAGTGIEIVDGKISVKVAENSHGLVAVNGSMTMLLATAEQDGAMSKEDKRIIDSIPNTYIARKYDIADTPEGTLVDYRDHEIRVMCPYNAEFTKQAVGVGGDANTYYMTFKTYAPNDNVVGYIEHIGNQSDSEILTKFSVDEHGRRYQPTWLGLAKFDEATGAWTYNGSESMVNKFIGWDYRIDWYDANNQMVASDCVRINLSNESCHNSFRSYYGPDNDISTEVESIKKAIVEMEESYTWGEM